MSARDDYPELGALRDAYIDGTPQVGGFEAGRALAEIDWLRGREVLLRSVIDEQINEIAELQVLGDQLAQAFRAMGGLDVAYDAWLRAWEEARRD